MLYLSQIYRTFDAAAVMLHFVDQPYPTKAECQLGNVVANLCEKREKRETFFVGSDLTLVPYCVLGMFD